MKKFEIIILSKKSPRVLPGTRISRPITQQESQTVQKGPESFWGFSGFSLPDPGSGPWVLSGATHCTGEACRLGHSLSAPGFYVFKSQSSSYGSDMVPSVETNHSQTLRHTGRPS